MQNLDHLNREALGFMVKLSTVQPPTRTASTQAILCSAATGPSCVQPEHAPKQPLPLLLMQPSVPATPGHKPAQPLPAAPLQIERTVTPPPTQPQQQEQQISETPVVHVNQQTTRSGQLVRLPQKYKDFVLSLQDNEQQGTHERANLRLPTVFFFSFSPLVIALFLRGGGMSRYVTFLLLRYSHLILA